MTPERYEYEKECAAIERQLRAGRKELGQLLGGADEFELVMTVELEPNWPLAMGHYRMVGQVRITRARQQRLEALRAAAEKSEAP